MPQYTYKALTQGGTAVTGKVSVDNLGHFYKELSRQNLYCLDVAEVRESAGFQTKGRLPLRELSVLCRQLGSMAAAGVTINHCLDVIYKQTERSRTKKLLSKLYEQVQKGKMLSEAMAEADGAFPPLMVNMVKSGESSSTLDAVLGRLAEHYEKEQKLRNKAVLALLYPMVLVVVSLAVVIVLFAFVLPTLLSMYTSLESLPWYTRMLIGISDIVVNKWPALLLVLAVFVVGLSAIWRMERFRLWWDTVKLRLPVAGKLLTQLLSARFCRSFSSLFASGVPVLSALELTSKILDNRYAAARLIEAGEDIRKGASISAALQKSGVFPQMMIAMLAVGEESGDLEGILLKTSDYYDEQADTAIQQLVGLLQPVMIIVLGLVIGMVILAVLSPIYSMYGQL